MCLTKNRLTQAPGRSGSKHVCTQFQLLLELGICSIFRYGKDLISGMKVQLCIVDS